MGEKLRLTYKFEKPYVDSTINRDTENHLLVEVRPESELMNSAMTVKGIDFCLVLDVSGSMRDSFEGRMTKIEAAISAAKNLYDFITPEDTVSIVLYDSATYTVMERKKPTKYEFEAALDQALRYSGSTNISQALRRAREILRPNTGNLKKIIFLTDGLPTDDREEDGLMEGKMIGEEKISITALGIGKDFNYKFIEELVKPSRGTTDWLKSPQEAIRIFQQSFMRTKATVVTNVELTLQFSGQVRVTDFYRAIPEATYYGKLELDRDRTVRVKLDDIENNRFYQYVFQVTIPAAKQPFDQRFRVARAVLTYYVPVLNQTFKQEEDILIEFTTDSEKALSRYQTVSETVARCYINKLDTNLNEKLKIDDKKSIVAILKELIEKSRDIGEYELEENYQKMLDDFVRSGRIPNELLIKASQSSTKVNGDGTIEKEINLDEIF